MSELRRNPLLETWTIVAGNRQGRPNMPKDWCPFCPGSGKVPDAYTVYVYPNDFPALSLNPPAPDVEAVGIYEVAPSLGACEVILFSSNHTGSLYDLPAPHMRELIDLWADRVAHYAADERIQYVYPFENRGPEVGVTMPHPHGQIYAFSYVPAKLEQELKACKAFYERTGGDMLGEMNRLELEDGRRILAEDEHWICYLPYFTDFPYGAFVVPRRMVSQLTDLSDIERESLGTMLKLLTGGYDALFDRPFPYMMCHHAAPVNAPQWAGCEAYFRFHIEFYPPLRDASRIKYYASTETGAWAAANTRAIEDTAPEMRQAMERFARKEGLSYNA